MLVSRVLEIKRAKEALPIMLIAADISGSCAIRSGPSCPPSLLFKTYICFGHIDVVFFSERALYITSFMGIYL